MRPLQVMVGRAVVLRVRAAATSLSARRGTAVRRSISAGVLCCESAQSWITCPRRPDRPRVFDFARGVSAVLRLLSAAINRICAATLLWTIVVLRDGRRCRSWRADVAQLVAHHLAKVRVAGSNPVIRSRCSRINPQRWSGRVVRQRPAKPCTRVRFPSPPPRWTRAISSAGERFPDTEEVTGSIPVSRTKVSPAHGTFGCLEPTWNPTTVPGGATATIRASAFSTRSRPSGRAS